MKVRVFLESNPISKTQFNKGLNSLDIARLVGVSGGRIRHICSDIKKVIEGENPHNVENIQLVLTALTEKRETIIDDIISKTCIQERAIANLMLDEIFTKIQTKLRDLESGT